MKDETFDSIRRDTLAALDAERLADALEGVRALADMSGDWALKSDVAETASGYRMMLHYFRSGTPDEGRHGLYRSFLYKCYTYCVRAERICKGRTSADLYYATLRTLQTMQLSFAGLVGQMEENARLLAECPAADGHPAQATEHERQHTELCRRLFDFVWTSDEWGDDAAATAQSFLLSPLIREADQALFVSALTLAALHAFDAAKYACLLDLLSDSRPLVSSRAWVGFVLVTLTHDRRIRLLPAVVARLATLGGDKDFTARLRNVQIQLLMTLETQEIEKQLREEILPAVMKSPRAGKPKTGINDLIEEMLKGDDPNPDWRGNKEVRRMEEKLARLAELQAQGADVYMGTFATMKQHFPFFSVPANWFTVFDSRHPDVAAALRGVPAFFGKLLSTDILCDSDKYSFALMLASIPEAQRSLMQQQFAAFGMDGAADFPAGTAAHDGEAVRRLCLQDLYRFFRLFAQRRQFANPFAGSLILADCVSLRGLLDDDESMMQVAEFAFRHKFYARALCFYGKLPPESATVEICQKTGFCHQELGDYEEALRAYRRAALLDADNAWTLRHTGQCAMLCGRFDEALDCWEKLARMNADDLQAEYRVGETLVHLGRYDEAFAHLFKVDYLEPDRPRTQRALAWCSLMAHKPAQAEKYYRKLLDGQPTREDYMNAGHTAWVSGDVPLALQRYAACVEASGQPMMPPGFFDEDAAVLASYGISPDDMRILIDAANQPD